jgi:Phycobilisome degradation protein nblA
MELSLEKQFEQQKIFAAIDQMSPEQLTLYTKDLVSLHLRHTELTKHLLKQKLNGEHT